ncbi:acyltransferase family protein [Intestinibacter bartlettii]|uniref:acyltransferase family protein n=1 Tax=Intestinibacter bartlettii TaxID=261299 RepID=UPI0039962D6E
MKLEIQGKNKLSELEVFSGIAILYVVLIHCNSYYLLNILNLQAYENAYFYIRLLDNFVHAAVPMFIFISGYKYALNNINEDYKKYVSKRIKKVLKPFLIISTIFFINYVIKNPNEYKGISNIIIGFINIFMGYNIAFQLWYIPMYIFIVCTYPIIYIKFKTDKNRMIFILVILLLQYLLGINIDRLSMYPFSFVYYYLFFEMGVMFCKYNLKSKIEKNCISIIIIYISSVIVLSFNFIPGLYIFFQTYLLYPLSVVAYYVLSLKLINIKVLNFLGKYSFYIFLLHEPIIGTKISYLFNKIGIYNSMIYVFISCILTIMVTFIVYKVIQHTFINKILFNVK